MELAPRYGIRLLRSAEPPDGPQRHVGSERKAWDVMGTRVEFVGQTGQIENDLVLLRLTVTDLAMRARARKLGKAIRREDGVAAAVTIFTRLRR